MKKTFFVLSFCFLSIYAFSQNISLSSITEDNLSWRVLEKAESAFDEKNFSKATKLVQTAEINRKRESQTYVYILEQALKPLQVQNVGNKIDDVLEILDDRGSTEAVKIISDIVHTKGIDFFDDDVQNILAYYKDYHIYPECYFLHAKIYQIEGEFDLAEEYYLLAWENSSKLDIPMMKYDILYNLAFLYNIQGNLDDYEKTLLFIVADDPSYYQNGSPSPFLTSVTNNIKNGLSLDKLFLLYRLDSYNQINAYFQLALLYEKRKNYNKMLEVSALGMISAITRIETIFYERELEYSFTNFNHFFSLVSKHPDIVEWGIENDIWQGFYYFATALEMNNLGLASKEMYNSNRIYSPEQIFRQKSEDKLN